MKKTIKLLQEKMQPLKENNQGMLRGGYANIKGGFSSVGIENNLGCSNTADCTKGTNTFGCVNSGTCFM